MWEKSQKQHGHCYKQRFGGVQPVVAVRIPQWNSIEPAETDQLSNIYVLSDTCFSSTNCKRNGLFGLLDLKWKYHNVYLKSDDVRILEWNGSPPPNSYEVGETEVIFK